VHRERITPTPPTARATINAQVEQSRTRKVNQPKWTRTGRNSPKTLQFGRVKTALKRTKGKLENNQSFQFIRELLSRAAED